MISRRTISRLLAGLLGSLAVLSASAQGFPNKMVTVMVPYPAAAPRMRWPAWSRSNTRRTWARR